MKTLSQSDAAALKARIAQLISANADRKAQWRSMKSVRWCLYSPQLGLWAGLSDRAEIVPVTTQAAALISAGTLAEARAACLTDLRIRLERLVEELQTV